LARRSVKRAGGRSSSVVEHVSQFVPYPSFLAGRRLWVIMDPVEAV
jgi:hypothetical protein